MKVRKDASNWLIVLEKGDKLVESLQEAIIKEGIKTGWIFGLGACSWAEIGFYDLKSQNYHWKKYQEPLEILSLQGNVSLSEDQPTLHVHGTFSNDQLQSIGGHVKDLEVAGTCEIFLHDWFASPISRKADPNTGLNLLDL